RVIKDRQPNDNERTRGAIAPELSKLYARSAQALENQGRLTEAQSQYGKAIAHLREPRLFIARARISEKLREPEQAIADLTSAIDLIGHENAIQRAPLYGSRARVFSQLSNWQSAVIDLTEAIKLTPANTGLKLDRAKAFANLEDWQAAA